jgi:phospholipid-transporting ATPase
MWTGTSLFDPTIMLMYNVAFTIAQPFTLGLFDQSETMEARMKNPLLYEFSQRGRGYNEHVFWDWIQRAVLQSTILFWLPMLAMETGVNNAGGHSEGYLELSNTIYTCVVLTVTAKAAIEKETISPLCVLLLGGSVLVWILFLTGYSYFWLLVPVANPAMLDSVRILVTNTGFWFCVITAPTVCASIDILLRSTNKMTNEYKDFLEYKGFL